MEGTPSGARFFKLFTGAVSNAKIRAFEEAPFAILMNIGFSG
jgi:hypothetical protein